MEDDINHRHIQVLEHLLSHVTFNSEISAKLLGRLSKSPFIHISHRFWHNHSYLVYGPTFYIVIRINKDDLDGRDKLKLQLSTYSGRLLSTLAEHWDLSQNLVELVSNSNLIKQFTQGDLQLCRGLPKSVRRSNLTNLAILREAVGERIVSRSQQCHFVTLISNLNQVCKQCLDFNHETEIEVKSEWEDEGEDLDDYNTDEFLDNDDVRVISITQGLPAKLSQLSGISIRKTDGDDSSSSTPTPKPIPATITRSPALLTTSGGSEESPLFPEPQVNLTVLVNDGRQAKELPFNDFRKDLDIETERERIREPVLSKKRKKPSEPPEKRTRRSEKANKNHEVKREITTKTSTNQAKKPVKSCPQCNKPFTEISDFMKHLSTCEAESEHEDLGDVFGGGQGDSDEDYKPVLDENGIPGGAASKVRFIERKKAKSGKKLPAGSKKKPLVPVECTVCMTSFKHDTNFPQHMKAHEDKIDLDSPMTCPVCSIEIESKRALNPHMKENHPEKGGCCVECLEFMPVLYFLMPLTDLLLTCGIEFQMNLLKSHLSRKHHHAPEREGQLCPVCGKKCYYTADLEIHIAVQHMGLALERPPKDEGEVMCHECGKVNFLSTLMAFCAI